jgi:hypothetical protein
MNLGVVHKPQGSCNRVGWGLASAPPYCPITLLFLDCFTADAKFTALLAVPQTNNPSPPSPQQLHASSTHCTTPSPPPPRAS